MNQDQDKPKHERKGLFIRSHKGGRTTRVDARLEPEVKNLLQEQLSERKESLSDWITRLVWEQEKLKH